MTFERASALNIPRKPACLSEWSTEPFLFRAKPVPFQNCSFPHLVEPLMQRRTIVSVPNYVPNDMCVRLPSERSARGSTVAFFAARSWLERLVVISKIFPIAPWVVGIASTGSVHLQQSVLGVQVNVVT
jgi:hypothetical protein